MARNITNFSKSFMNLLKTQGRVTSTNRLFSLSCTSLTEKWRLGKLNHVAIAVTDLEKSMSMYRDVLGATVSDPEPQTDHGVYTVFVELGDTKIELLYPLGENSPIEGFLQKNKNGGIHHICLEVSNIYEAMDTLKEREIRVLDKKPKIGAHGKPVVFLHPKDCGGVLVELEEI